MLQILTKLPLEFENIPDFKKIFNEIKYSYTAV